jgi:hypothetical protein
MNGLPGDPKTDSHGNYHADVPDGWSGAVYPQSNSLHFNPDFRVYTHVTANRDDDYDTTLPSPVISGTIRTASGQVVPGVTMHGLSGTPVTNYHGYYLCQVRNGFSGTVRPEKDGYTFNPPSISYDDPDTTEDGQNYMAIEDNTVAISGTVRTAAGKAVAGVTMSGLPAATKTNASGYYIAIVPDGWAGTVTPQKTDYTFDPPFLPYSSPTENQPDQSYVATPPPIILTITSCPTTVKHGKSYNVAWTIANGKPTKYNHVEWWTSLDPTVRSTGNDVKPAYKVSPKAPAKPCTLYLRVHAVIDGVDYPSAIRTVTVQ